MPDLEINIRTVNQLTPELVSFIQRTHAREFSDDPMVYAALQWYLFGCLLGEPVTQVGVLQRAITINSKPLVIAGLCFLVTEPDSRHLGYATLIMKEAVHFVKTKLHLPFGLLTCRPSLESVYLGMGWRTIKEPNTYVQPTGNQSCGARMMVSECGGDPWPSGEIDFCGLPW